MERGERRAKSADRIVWWALATAYALMLFVAWYEHGAFVCAFVCAALLVILGGTRWIRTITRTESIDDLVAGYAEYAPKMANPRTRAYWARSIGRIVTGATIVFSFWAVDAGVSGTRWIAADAVLLAIAGVIGIVITVGGVGYAVWYLIRTRHATP